MAGPLSTEALTDEWVNELVAATADLPTVAHQPVSVTFTIGKKRSATIVVENGRVAGLGDPGSGDPGSGDGAAVTIPSTDDQLAAFIGGTASMAEAYMRGDLKPEGATGDFLPVIEMMENLGRA